MANTYSWTIQKLSYEVGPDSEGHSDIVNNIDWLLTASDGEDPPHEALWSGITHVSWEEGDDWIPYEDLTQSDIVGWVEGGFAEGELDSMKSKLDAQIEEEVNPTEESTSDMPWDEDNGA